MNRFFFSVLLATGFFFTSCEKEPGPGGLAKITGRVYETEYNSAGNPRGAYDKADQRVYIRYGDNMGIDDDTRTAFDGTFKFDNLQAGEYTVFTYSDCNNCASGVEAVIVPVSISFKEHKDLDTLHVSKY